MMNKKFRREITKELKKIEDLKNKKAVQEMNPEQLVRKKIKLLWLSYIILNPLSSHRLWSDNWHSNSPCNYCLRSYTKRS